MAVRYSRHVDRCGLAAFYNITPCSVIAKLVLHLQYVDINVH